VVGAEQESGAVLFSGGTQWHGPRRPRQSKSFLAPRPPKWRNKVAIQLDLMGSIPFYSINGSPVEERGIDDTNSDDCDFFLTGANNTI
jgi:hypothetical protein